MDFDKLKISIDSLSSICHNIVRADTQKKSLVKVGVVDDLLALLENYVCAPDVAAEALGVIACLSDSGKAGLAIVEDVTCQPLFCVFTYNSFSLPLRGFSFFC